MPSFIRWQKIFVTAEGNSLPPSEQKRGSMYSIFSFALEMNSDLAQACSLVSGAQERMNHSILPVRHGFVTLSNVVEVNRPFPLLHSF